MLLVTEFEILFKYKNSVVIKWGTKMLGLKNMDVFSKHCKKNKQCYNIKFSSVGSHEKKHYLQQSHHV